MLPAALAAEYLRQREALLAEYPELADDAQALADTLEGFADAPDVIASFVRGAIQDEAMVNALDKVTDQHRQRRSRILARSEKRRKAAQALMAACDLRKIELPDMTVSIRAVPPKVEITDEAALPDSLCKFTRSPNKALIKEVLAIGPVAGAHLTNGAETISIRTS